MLNDQVPVEVRGASRDGAVDEGPVDEDFNLAGRFFPTPDMGALVTPGQFLLKSLNHPRTRTSKISAIHTAKMKLPKMQANHSRAPDMTIFGDVRAETRSLLTQVPAAQAWMEGVHDMERSKAARHDRAWRVYLEQRGEVEDTHRDRIASALQASRSELDAMGAELDRNCARLTDDEQLMMLDEGSVHGAWDDLNSVLRQREKAIAELGNLLEEEEARRRADQEALMLDTLAALMSIAHASEGAVERMMETEALEMNLALLRDRRAAASLLQRLKAREVGLEEQSRRTWEGSMERWRSLRTKHAIGRFVARIRSQEFAEPRERVEQLARARRAGGHV
ncbi:unnamed protein product [Pedinophyceae sp. YPF-701]|nr:unnamed protein product [Pedinophyceae sp. YPF-701]